MRIDVHAHMMPEVFVEGDEVRIPINDSGRLHTRALNATNFDRETIDVGRRLQDMDAQGIDIHVVSLQPMFTVALPVEEAVAVSRAINNAFADVVAEHPKRFKALADLPLHSPDEAVEELERAVKQLGLSGAEICSQVKGINLDNLALRPVFAKA